MRGAVCVRCGSDKPTAEAVCASCGHRPQGDGLLVAWLLSEAHLSPDRLDAAAARLRAGESIRPSDAMLDKARIALGRHLSRDPGLDTPHRLALLATSLLVTPLVGLVLWWWWRDDRPRSSLQALWLSLPASVFFFVLVSWIVLGSRGFVAL